MDFQKLLLAVGKALSKDEVKALAFLCTDVLSRNPNSVESTGELFSRLADQDHLSAEQPHLLTELLLIIQRARLVRELQLPDSTRSLISPYRKLLYNLSEDITVQELKDMKFLLISYLPRKKLEENTTLEVFLEMEHMDLISDTHLDLLENIFLQVCPMLKEKIHQFKAQQVPQMGPISQETGRPRAMTHSFEQNQAYQPSDHERTRLSESEISEEFSPLAESTGNSSNSSLDFPNVLRGGDECDALSHGLRSLSTETSFSASSEASTDDMKMLLSQKNETSSEKQTSQTTNTDTEVLGTYPMTSGNRGICLIINNNDFTHSKPTLNDRTGTMVDEECLHKVFKWLGFEVRIQKDCKRQEMLSVMREIGSEDHSQMDCFVCCVLSHGKEEGVHGVDGNIVQLNELIEPVNGLNCSSLAEKPKLFFIQACQGTREQQPVNIVADGPSPGFVCSDAFKVKESIPSDADFLFGMATVPSFASFRDRTTGTWFIQSLCQNLVKMVPSGWDLVSILTKVNADVSKKTDHYGVKKQMPQPAFSLRKKVVFPVPEAPPPSL